MAGKDEENGDKEPENPENKTADSGAKPDNTDAKNEKAAGGKAKSGAKSAKASEKKDENAESSNAEAGTAEPYTAWEKARDSFSQVDWSSRGEVVLRLIMMLVAIAIAGAVGTLIYVVAFAHTVYALITREKLAEVSDLSGRLAAYVHQLLDFIGYHSDRPIFPFAPFPEASDNKNRDAGAD